MVVIVLDDTSVFYDVCVCVDECCVTTFLEYKYTLKSTSFQSCSVMKACPKKLTCIVREAVLFVVDNIQIV